MSNSLIDNLPGMPIRVPEVSQALATMWDPADVDPDHPINESHATQVNLVLHFGLSTTPDEARERFDIAIRFAQRYPCRIIVLCPQHERDEQALMRAKLFSQCYVGKNFREMCCCEAVIVGYNTQESTFLDNQVSLWLESDLPIYHWLHRVPAEAIERHYMAFLSRCNRIVYDYSIDGSNYSTIKWPSRNRLRDLSLARTLSPRQALGQFLSGVEPALLATGLRSVVTRYAPGFVGEAGNMSCWQEYCLEICRKRAGITEPAARFTVEPLESSSPNTIETEWTYASGQKFFSWSMRASSSTGHIDMDLGTGRRSCAIQVSMLREDKSLGEALFFNNWTV